MSVNRAGPAATTDKLVFPALARFYASSEPIAYAALRVWLGLVLVTHGYPKLFHLGHGASADAYAGLVHVIDVKMHFPAAAFFALLVTILESVGAVFLALGIGTRLVAAMLAIEMLVIALGVHWPRWEWTKGGMEYPLILAAAFGYIAIRGGGKYSIDRLLKREI